MWCLITSPRERGGKDLESSTCSLSWRRQCCPADRRCTELLRQGGAAPRLGCVCVCVNVCRLWGGSRKDCGILFWRCGLKEPGAKGQEAKTGEAQVYTGQRRLETSPRWDLICSMAQSVMLDSFFIRFDIYMQGVKSTFGNLDILTLIDQSFTFLSQVSSAMVSALLIFIESAHVALMMKVPLLDKAAKKQKDKPHG